MTIWRLFSVRENYYIIGARTTSQPPIRTVESVINYFQSSTNMRLKGCLILNTCHYFWNRRFNCCPKTEIVRDLSNRRASLVGTTNSNGCLARMSTDHPTLTVVDKSILWRHLPTLAVRITFEPACCSRLQRSPRLRLPVDSSPTASQAARPMEGGRSPATALTSATSANWRRGGELTGEVHRLRKSALFRIWVKMYCDLR